MFEQTSRLAEKVATSVSRRGFLGSLGGWAAAAAIGVAGLLTGTRTARAGTKSGMCCFYSSSSVGVGGTFFFKGATACPAICAGANLTSANLVPDCASCVRATNCQGCKF
jgi:hypothetical protein